MKIKVDPIKAMDIAAKVCTIGGTLLSAYVSKKEVIKTTEKIVKETLKNTK